MVFTPAGYWSKLHTAISKFIWNGKRPGLRSATVQRRILDGGLAVPNFKLYHWSFTLRPLVVWFYPQTAVFWRTMEERMVHPWSLADVLFANISVRQSQLPFGLIVTHLIQVWCSLERICNISCRWQSPIFNNKGLLIRGRPVTYSQWEKGGIQFLGDIFGLDGLRSFQDIKNNFNLPGTSFFFYLQLGAALKAHGIP